MSKGMKIRLGTILGLVLLVAALISMESGGTGAYFNDSHGGEITGSTGSIKVHTSGGSGPEGLNFNFKYLLPGEPQTATVEFKNTGHNKQDVWVVFSEEKALHALNNLGQFGEVTISDPGGTVFHSANLNDNKYPASGNCGPISPAGCWPLGEKYKVASNVSPGAGSWFKFTFGYTTYKGGIGNDQQEEAWNSYPPEAKRLGVPVEGSGLPFEVVAMQTGVEP